MTAFVLSMIYILSCHYFHIGLYPFISVMRLRFDINEQETWRVWIWLRDTDRVARFVTIVLYSLLYYIQRFLSNFFQIFRKGDAIMQCVETSLMKCDDPTPSNLVHGLLNAMKDGTPCARAAQGWHSGYSVSQTRIQLLVAVLALASVNLSLWWIIK